MVLKIFCKIGENTAFLQFSSGIFLQIFENSPASGGLRPSDPLRGRTPYLEPPEIFSCVRHWRRLKEFRLSDYTGIYRVNKINMYNRNY